MTALSLSSAFAIIACTPGSSDPRSTHTDVTTVDHDVASVPQPGQTTTGGDGSQITLNALAEGDLSDLQSGELFCNFQSKQGDLLVVASGIVGVDNPARAVIKVASYVETMSNTSGPGFGAMVEGANFTGKGKTVLIETKGDDRSDIESSTYNAALTYMRGDGAQLVIDGDWTCGP